MTGGFGMSGEVARMSSLTVTVTHNDTSVTLQADGGYSPDLIDDLCRRAAGTLVATIAQLVAVLVDEDD